MDRGRGVSLRLGVLQGGGRVQWDTAQGRGAPTVGELGTAPGNGLGDG